MTKRERLARARKLFDAGCIRIPITKLEVRTLGQRFEIGDAWIQVGGTRLNGADASSFHDREVIDTEGVEVTE